MFSRKNTSENKNSDAAQTQAHLEELALDQTEGETASILRENARLQLELTFQKRRNLRVWSINGVVAASLVALVGGFLSLYPKYRYIPTTDNRTICEVTPQSAPRISAADATSFAKDAVLNSYSYDYVNYRTLINDAASRWYTPEGHAAFMKGLEESGNLQRVIKGNLILRSMATRTPQLEEVTPSAEDPQTWTVLVPIVIEFYVGGSDKPLSRQEFTASVKVVRVQASASNIKGISVDSVVLLPPRN